MYCKRGFSVQLNGVFDIWTLIILKFTWKKKKESILKNTFKRIQDWDKFVTYRLPINFLQNISYMIWRILVTFEINESGLHFRCRMCAPSWACTVWVEHCRKWLNRAWFGVYARTRAVNATLPESGIRLTFDLGINTSLQRSSSSLSSGCVCGSSRTYSVYIITNKA